MLEKIKTETDYNRQNNRKGRHGKEYEVGKTQFECKQESKYFY